MTAAPHRWAADLLHYWFHILQPSNWFGSSERVDDALRERFGDELERQGARPATHFLDHRDTARAAILLFDQVPRNIHRGTPQAFAYDPLACAICHAVLERGWDEGLTDHERQFVAMPLMHSEELADQQACVAYFREHLPDSASFAEKHREMIARFGRFPHRNEILGRETSEAEQRAIEEGFSW